MRSLRNGYYYYYYYNTPPPTCVYFEIVLKAGWYIMWRKPKGCQRCRMFPWTPPPKKKKKKKKNYSTPAFFQGVLGNYFDSLLSDPLLWNILFHYLMNPFLWRRCVNRASLSHRVVSVICGTCTTPVLGCLVIRS